MWWALTQANTDSDVMTIFIRKLMGQLDRDSPGWQEDTTILLDNAAWHTSPVMKQRLARMQVPTTYSGPYCYSSAPVVSTYPIIYMFHQLTSHLPYRNWSSPRSSSAS